MHGRSHASRTTKRKTLRRTKERNVTLRRTGLGKCYAENTTASNVYEKIAGTANNLRNLVKTNKGQLLSTANSLQTIGKNTTRAGLLCALAGTPVAGVGATPGLALAASGSCLSSMGLGLELGVDLISGNTNTLIENGLDRARDYVISKAIIGIIPGMNVVNTAITNEVAGEFISVFNLQALDNFIFKINQ